MECYSTCLNRGYGVLRYLSDREGEEGLMMKGESKRLRVSYCREPQSDIVRERGAPTHTALGLFFFIY